MERRSRSRENMTSLRPRPVTATVTKPSWMRPEAIAGPRSHSVESRGSTASLTSVLEHDSCESLSEDEFERQDRLQRKENLENFAKHVKKQQDLQTNMNIKKDKKVPKKKVMRKYVESSQTEDTESYAEPSLSPWEQWLIQKVKDDRQKRKEERQKKAEEKQKKSEDVAVKQKKLEKADEIRKDWTDRKTFEEKLKIKLDKQRSKTEKMIKEEQKKMEAVKADRKFNEWIEEKRRETIEKKRDEKNKQLEEEKMMKAQKVKAQNVYEEWCKKADQKTRPMPNSFGYTSGKLTGYHDTSAYPVPTFYNPMPWQPIHMPRPASDKKQKRRNKPKPKYVWNPEKYR